MLKRQRQAYILDLLVRDKFVRVEDLAKDLNVSVVTIRRDISELD
ncbi:MAG: DeoR/GlpR transcriptional regulator, partial [Erysipelothrix sp.]|nr:DeoR/GlpR transcriptional regulator [Erysipelothrix sp.]